MLGSWQVSRLQWKNKLLANLKTHVVALPQKISNTRSWQYRKVKISGWFLYDKIFYLYNSNNRYNVIIPIKTLDNRFILINRGEVSHKIVSHKTSKSVIVNIEGVIYYPTKKVLFIKNDLHNNIWFYIDIKTMAKLSVLPLEQYTIVETSHTTPFIVNKITIRNRHLEYIITWYSLAMVLLLYKLQHIYNHRIRRSKKTTS